MSPWHFSHGEKLPCLALSLCRPVRVHQRNTKEGSAAAQQRGPVSERCLRLPPAPTRPCCESEERPWGARQPWVRVRCHVVSCNSIEMRFKIFRLVAIMGATLRRHWLTMSAPPARQPACPPPHARARGGRHSQSPAAGTRLRGSGPSAAAGRGTHGACPPPVGPPPAPPPLPLHLDTADPGRSAAARGSLLGCPPPRPPRPPHLRFCSPPPPLSHPRRGASVADTRRRPPSPPARPPPRPRQRATAAAAAARRP